MLQANIYFDKDDLLGSQSLEEFIMEFLLKKKVSGATAFRGAFGFGQNQHMKQPNLLFSFDEPPMMITFVDEDEKVKRTLTDLRKVFKGGLITTHLVDRW
jgi:PII-like signaling protein